MSKRIVRLHVLGVLRLLAIAFLFGVGGCAGEHAQSPAQDARPPMEHQQGRAMHEGRSVFQEEVLERVSMVERGKKDRQNRYKSTVQVVVYEPLGVHDAGEEKGPNGATGQGAPGQEEQERETYSECSGVVVGPKLVLTAGHCVCKEREDILQASGNDKVKLIVDGTSCARDVAVKLVSYALPPARPGESVKEYPVEKIVPHASFKLIFELQDDGRRFVVSSDWDLAVLFLKDSVDQEVPVARLAQTEVKEGEQVVLVGYGPLKENGAFGTRRYGGNQITKVQNPKPSGSVDFYVAQPEAHLYGGDSGGGCFRESGQGLELVGIAGSRATVRDPTGRNSKRTASIFTSTYSSMEWLKKMGRQ